MCVAPEQPDLHTLGRGGYDPGAPADGPGRSDHHVLAEHDFGLGEAVEEPVVDHGLFCYPGATESRLSRTPKRATLFFKPTRDRGMWAKPKHREVRRKHIYQGAQSKGSRALGQRGRVYDGPDHGGNMGRTKL